MDKKIVDEATKSISINIVTIHEITSALYKAASRSGNTVMMQNMQVVKNSLDNILTGLVSARRALKKAYFEEKSFVQIRTQTRAYNLHMN